jgi:hypothetical protein
MDGIVDAEGGNANVMNMHMNMNIANNCILPSHKLLRTPVPNDLVFGFIHKIAHKIPNSNYYLIDVCAYKKAMYYDAETEAKPSLLQQFCNDLMPYYCKDKQFFVTRKMSHNNMNTILRQVCRHCAIECKSERKYDKSKTQIVYYICDNLNPQ